MTDRANRIALAVLPTLQVADRLVERLHTDGHALQGGLLLGGDATATSPRRVLLTALEGSSLWGFDNATAAPNPTASPLLTDVRDAGTSARRTVERLARELPDAWREVHDHHLGGHAVLGLLPVKGGGEHEVRLGRTVLEHAHGFFGLFDLLDTAPDR